MPAQEGTYYDPSPKQDCYDDADTCPNPTLDNKGTISPDKSEYDVFETVTFGCDSTSSLVGVTTSRCESGGTWNPSTVPSCADKCLPPVVANSDYATQLQPVDHATTITVECDPGYSTGTGTDTDMTCNNGNFDVADPVCYECRFEDLPAQEGTYFDPSPTQDCYDSGTRILYQCTGGTLYGPPYNDCNGGTWAIPFAPTCEADYCPRPTLDNKGTISPDKVEYNPFETVTFGCDNTSSLVGVITSRCESGGTWNPSIVPSCAENTCGRPTLDDKGTISPDKQEYNAFERVDFGCGGTSTLVGVATGWCEWDGTWNPSAVPSCADGEPTI
ncbi:complement receptor type 2-like [Diadema antillarum]|uniref:complement receptor type 2-like n=1 Tax=Diadema antillarum TaxID=105358 RepID=UPI003A8B54DB